MDCNRESPNEAERLRGLDRYRLLDTPREQDFDEIAEAAAELCETPIAVVNLVGDGRQFFNLGRAHDIPILANWTEAPIAEAVEGALSIHRGGTPSRIRASGTNVPLSAKAALALALALHEFATNSAKYGALSLEAGSVDLRWHVVHEDGSPRFALTWSERAARRSWRSRPGAGSAHG